MSDYVYFDLLDTARTAIGRLPDETKRANDCIRLGQAELKVSVLRGRTPVFPQTYGWDSAALLSYGAEEGFEGASFRWLLEKGFIRVRLLDQPSIWQAALAAFQSPAYRGFGAWPELSADNPEMDRKALVEAMRTGKYPSAVPDRVRNRLDVLRQLSDAGKQAPPAEPELPRGDKLRRLIEHAAEAAQRVEPTVANVLLQCTRVPDPNNRTAIHTFLDIEEGRGKVVPPGVREVVSGCFNVVAAECVGATRTGVTFPLSSPVAVGILEGALPGSTRIDLFEGPLTEDPGLSDLSDLAPLRWQDVKRFVQDYGELSPTRKEREAEAAKLIATVAVERAPRYALKTEVWNFLFKSAIWSSASYVGYTLAGPLGAGIAVVCGLAGGFGDLDFRATVKKRRAAALEKKWQGLLHAG